MVSTQGRVAKLMGFPLSEGYIGVSLCQDGRYASVHRLVALTFIGPPKPGQTDINHLNGVRHDNRVENLEWSTRAENLAHGLERSRNDESTLRAYTKQQYLTARKMRARSASYAEIEQATGMTPGAAHSAIYRSKKWR